MGRLEGRGLGTRLSQRQAAASPRLRAASTDAQRNADKPWRKLYASARWRKLREVVLARAGGRCAQTQVFLVGTYPAPNSPVVDHIVPVERFWFRDPDRFWDLGNLQAVSKRYHDTEKQRRERRA